MKFLFQLLFCSSLLFLGLNFTACESSGKEYTSLYTCPMKCTGSGSDKSDKCPVCKMDYTLNEKHVDAPKHQDIPESQDAHDGHDHGAHDGHDHGSHEGHNH